MKKLTALLALVSMLFVGPLAGADDRLLLAAEAHRTLAAAQAERTRNIATLDGLLTSPGADKAAAIAGLDVGRARRTLPRLSDADLRDLAGRAASLTSDPVAGHYYYHDDAADVLILVMIFAGLALVILAVADHY